MKIKPIFKIFVLISFFFLYGCTKMDTALEGIQENVEESFFKLKGTEHDAVIKVATTLKKQNNQTGFISSFTKKEGFAVWDKSIINQTAGATANRNGENLIETLVFTPIVQQGSSFVSGFFFSRIVGDSVALHLYRANDYDQFPCGNVDSNVVTAEMLTMKLVELNHIAFGYNKFVVKDSSLFKKYYPDATDTFYRTIQIKQKDSGTNISNYANFAITTAVFCQPAACNTSSITAKQGPTQCFNCYTFNIPLLAPDYQWPPDPDMPIVGGGGGGSGSGSGTYIPPSDGNCTGSNNCGQFRSMIVQGRVPCGGCGPGPILVGPFEDDDVDDEYGNNGSNGPYMCPNIFNSLQPQGQVLMLIE